MFKIGDLIVHPMHGAGVIESIVKERVAGEVKEYYVFKMPMGGLLLKIPVANSEVIGVRSIISAGEADRLLTAIPDMAVENNSNWNKRYQENMLRLKSGDVYQVARVIKSLTLRECRRGLSTGERKMLHNARQILISEVALTQALEYGEVEARVDAAMACRPAAQ